MLPDMLGDLDKYHIYGHNATNFVLPILRNSLEQNNLAVPGVLADANVVDTLLISRYCFPERNNHSWLSFAQNAEVPNLPQNRNGISSADHARILVETLRSDIVRRRMNNFAGNLLREFSVEAVRDRDAGELGDHGTLL